MKARALCVCGLLAGVVMGANAVGEEPLQVREWVEGKDDGSIYCLGNGKLCAYEEGPDVFQIFGPPYSAPPVLRLMVPSGQHTRAVSRREPGTAIVTHEIERQGAAVGTLQDFVDAELPCFVRELRLQEPLSLLFETEPDVEAVEQPIRLPSGEPAKSWLFTVPSGRYIFFHYPMPFPVTYRLVVAGAAAVERDGCSPRWEIRFEPGVSRVYVVGGPQLPQTQENTETAVSLAPEALLARTRAAWQAFTDRRHDFASTIPASAPERDALLQAIDDVAVAFKTQTEIEGGVLAGYNYHLLYVRDQYGVARCLLRLGYFDEAKGILERDWEIWKRHGRLHNAQGVGVDGVFHVHENDAVEITGYLIIQAFDYAETSGDEAFLEEILPMLDWAWTRQQEHLVRNMLPFNGDETYVAGGILPRSALNDGSAEATLLFIKGGAQLLGWAERRGLWSAERVAKERALLEEVRGAYLGNFFVDGRYITNNPARKEGLELPRFRHGVCEGCQASGKLTFGWTEKNAHGRYLCPRCVATVDLPAAPPEALSVQTVALTPLYMDADLPSRDDLIPIVRGLVEQFRVSGRLPSRPDGSVAVGFDYGLLLYALSELGDPAAEALYDRMMSVRDDTGLWAEYYDNHEPTGTRCRPWESGINLDAALAHVARKYKLEYSRP